MLYQSNTISADSGKMIRDSSGTNEENASPGGLETLYELLKSSQMPGLEDIMGKFGATAGKKSFLVFKNNKYLTIRTENIAFFYVKFDTTLITTFDRQEYSVNHSLEQIQCLLPRKNYYRINRQYLVGFNAVKEAEHYFARKLLVNLTIPTREKLIVSKEKVSSFLYWLGDR